MRFNEQKMPRYYGLPSSPSRRDRPDTKGSFSSIPKGLDRRWSVDEPPARQALVSEGDGSKTGTWKYLEEARGVQRTWRRRRREGGQGHLDVDGERRTSS
ncbi:hypothetical protein B9Z55_007911 [Caenorhabditis nigoni]|nr:hypothetical protein B9Z55_007911 [Caenorhabditis nigoni]